MQPPGYQPNTPQNPSDSLATTQPQFLANFMAMYNAFLVNHVSLTGGPAGTTPGNHTIVQILEQTEDPQTDVGEISVYVKKAPDQTDQIFISYQGNGTIFQYTNYQIYALTQTPQLSQYFTFLPGRVIVYFGSFTAALPKAVLPLNPPVAKNIITCTFCPNLPSNFKNLSYKPNVNKIVPTDKGYITKLQLQGDQSGWVSVGGQKSSSKLPPCFYAVLANI